MQIQTINYQDAKRVRSYSLSWFALKKAVNRYHFLCFFGCFIVLQVAYFCGLSLQRDFNVERNILAVENRVSLDLPRLSLPNPALNIAGNAEQIQEYLTRFNALLMQNNVGVRINSLQQFDANHHPDYFTSDANGQRYSIIERKLQLPGQTLSLALAVHQPGFWQSLSLYPLLAAALLVFLLSPYLQRKPAPVALNTEVSRVKSTELILDLENKCIRLSDSNEKVELANKPLCFYAALLTYCQQHPDARLCQHLALPEELLRSANQYFMRLVALGHTIRKRPDFDANLEKMLSEIRAALDELFIEHPEQKAPYYPPKALGEGSRSKMHNFALAKLGNADWNIKGK